MCERSCNATSQMSNCGALLCAIMKLVDFIHIMLVQFVWTNFPWGILMWRVFYGSWIHLRRTVVWWWYIVAKNTSAFSMNAWMEDRQRNARQLTLSAAVCLMMRKGRFIFSVARFIEDLRGLSFTRLRRRASWWRRAATKCLRFFLGWKYNEAHKKWSNIEIIEIAAGSKLAAAHTFTWGLLLIHLISIPTVLGVLIKFCTEPLASPAAGWLSMWIGRSPSITSGVTCTGTRWYFDMTSATKQYRFCGC